MKRSRANSAASKAAEAASASATANADAVEIVAPAPPHAPAAPSSVADVIASVVAARKDDLSDPALALRLVELVESGSSCRAAAITLGVNIRSAQQLIAKIDADVETTRSAVRRLMQREALARVDDWRTAADVGARKRGNHGPAKDWLLHAGVIDPLDSDEAQVRVQIHIGTEGHPLPIRSPLLEATTTSSGHDDLD